MTLFSSTIAQEILTVDDFELESGVHLRPAQVAYKTWGSLNDSKDNVMIICHAFTGSADVEDWWGPLMGPGKAFDPTRYFIFCANVLGSPYGTSSPLTINPRTGKLYGPEFPPTTIRDDVALHKLALDHLDVRSVAVVIGGSMGGMAVLEWPLCTPPGYVRSIIPLATAVRHSAWCISWGEAQRQSIYSDPAYEDGYYDVTNQPRSGLAAARMSALLTYRSRDSFERRFGRRPQTIDRPGRSPQPDNTAVGYHNEGHRSSRTEVRRESAVEENDAQLEGNSNVPRTFSAQGYLRYQGDKFVARFDANCYIHITRKMDTHDIARGRAGVGEEGESAAALRRVLSRLPKALVIGIQSDGLFMPSEQRELAEYLVDGTLVMIDSPDGHDGFLLEFEAINLHVLKFLKEVYGELYVGWKEGEGNFSIGKTSVFGEAESGVDVTRW